MQKILVIEDETDLRENIIEALENLYFEVLGAENGIVGLEVAREHLPDLIICDIMMPKLDGYGVLEALRQAPETATIPFIFLSAKREHSDIRKGMNLGADDYLTKPFTIPELNKAIETQIEKRVRIYNQYHQNLKKPQAHLIASIPFHLRPSLEEILILSETLINQYEVMETEIVREKLGKIQTAAQELTKLIVTTVEGG